MSGSVFSELVGQEAAIAEIKRAVAASRFVVRGDTANAAVKSDVKNAVSGNSLHFQQQNLGEVPEDLAAPETMKDPAALEYLAEPEKPVSYLNSENLNAKANISAAVQIARNSEKNRAIDAPDTGVPDTGVLREEIDGTGGTNILPQETQILNEAGEEKQLSIAAMTHAWLLTGPPGSGRSLAARAFAAALECTNQENLGCGECAACKAVMSGNHPDVEITSTDLVTISAQEVRNLVAQAYLAPASGRWRIFIIEDADRMLSRTTNVLLKAIEEPPEHTVWILCTTAPADVLPTIRSRCRNINLATPSLQSVAALLAKRENVALREALVAAQAAQSHIGLARALLTDPSAKALRWRTLSILVSIRGVGDAVIAAKAFSDMEYMLTPLESDKYPDLGAGIKKAATNAALSRVPENAAARKRENVKTKISRETPEDAAEKARIKKIEALGLDPNGKIPAALRAQISFSIDTEKRRKTRAFHDLIDRELIYLMGYFRDVLMCQLGASVALINPDFQTSIAHRAGATKAVQTLQVLDALSKARARLNANVTPQLLLEAVLIEIFLTTPES